jgi:hypothetical protein
MIYNTWTKKFNGEDGRWEQSFRPEFLQRCDNRMVRMLVDGANLDLNATVDLLQQGNATHQAAATTGAPNGDISQYMDPRTRTTKPSNPISFEAFKATKTIRTFAMVARNNPAELDETMTLDDIRDEYKILKQDYDDYQAECQKWDESEREGLAILTNMLSDPLKAMFINVSSKDRAIKKSVTFVSLFKQIDKTYTLDEKQAKRLKQAIQYKIENFQPGKLSFKEILLQMFDLFQLADYDINSDFEGRDDVQCLRYLKSALTRHELQWFDAGLQFAESSLMDPKATVNYLKERDGARIADATAQGEIDDTGGSVLAFGQQDRSGRQFRDAPANRDNSRKRGRENNYNSDLSPTVDGGEYRDEDPEDRYDPDCDARKKCHNCGNLGHFSYHCKANFCGNCGEKWHTSNRCPKLKKRKFDDSYDQSYDTEDDTHRQQPSSRGPSSFNGNSSTKTSNSSGSTTASNGSVASNSNNVSRNSSSQASGTRGRSPSADRANALRTLVLDRPSYPSILRRYGGPYSSDDDSN